MKCNFYKKHLPSYIDDLQAKGIYWFLGSEIQNKLNLSRNAASVSLWRLSQKNRICRIRGDFYVIVPPEHRSAGCLPAHWFIDPLMAFIGLPYYIALSSAASQQGAAHQQVMVLQVMTNKPLRKITVGNQQIRFYVKSPIEDSGLIQKKTPMSYFKLSNPELTALDLVRYANGIDQLQQAATIIAELVEQLNPDVLSQLVNTQSAFITTAQRLGYILEQLIDADLNLSPL